MIADEGFDDFCNARNENLPDQAKGTTYQAYYFRQLCLAKYLMGDGNAAVERAVQLMDGTFVSGNPLVAVLAQARMDRQAGASTIQTIYNTMTALKDTDVYGNYSTDDKAYFDQVYVSVAKWTGENI